MSCGLATYSFSDWLDTCCKVRTQGAPTRRNAQVVNPAEYNVNRTLNSWTCRILSAKPLILPKLR